MNLNEFWAKTAPFQSVLSHAIVSGCVAQFLFRDYLSQGDRELLKADMDMDDFQLECFVGYLVSLHDIGKIEFSFQAQDNQTLKKLRESISQDEIKIIGVRHEKTGQKSIRQIWRSLGYDRLSVSSFSKIVGAHHQGKGGKDGFKNCSVWFEFQKEFERKMRSMFYPALQFSFPKANHNRQGVTGALMLGLMILSDWISSGQLFADAERWIDSPDAKQNIKRKMQKFLLKSSLLPNRTSWDNTFCGVWPNIPAFGLRPLQAAVEQFFRDKETDYDILLIEAPMGEGKTEAGMYAALQMARTNHKDGFYVALPTAATSNQMVFRMRDLLKMHGLSDKVRLLHSMAWLSDTEEFNSQDEADEVLRWLVPAKRALLGQYAVGTVDQAMLAATNIKYGVLRLLGLSNKVLLVDEIHSYDAYMSEIIVRLLEWCKALRIPVVMLSATLPPAAKARLLAPYTQAALSEGYPLLTAVRSDGSVKEKIIEKTSHSLEVSIQMHSLMGNPKGIAMLAVERVKQGGCLCVLMNTVREAQEVYQEISMIYDDELILFHAQFPAEQRDELEKLCLRQYGKEKKNRPKRSILVATQVVEQSLDVDFDTMITAVAPIDLILQRMGRVFRHDNSPRPSGMTSASQWILIPEGERDFGASAYVYPECLLRRTVDLLSTVDEVCIPEDIARLVRDGYDPAQVPEYELKQWMENQVRDQVQAAVSYQYLINAPDKLFSPLDGTIQYEDEEEMGYLSAKTRLGEPSVRIALIEPEDLRILESSLFTKGKKRYIKVRNRELAEMVMKKSVSVRTSRLGDCGDEPEFIYGDGLLSGLRIYPSENAVCRLNNGKVIYFDRNLGLIIEDGEK